MEIEDGKRLIELECCPENMHMEKVFNTYFWILIPMIFKHHIVYETLIEKATN